MGLLFLQPLWALLSYCVAFALMSGGRDHSLKLSKTTASCTLTRHGLLFSNSRSIPLCWIRRFRVVTSHDPALTNENDDSGTNAYGIEAVSLGTRFVVGYVLEKSDCVALAEQLQTVLEDAHEKRKEGCPPPALLLSSCEYEGAVTTVDESATLVSKLPKGVVKCRRWGSLGHVSIVLRSSFPRQTAVATVLVNFEWYVTLAISLATTGTKLGDVARNWFVIVGSAIFAGAVILVFGAALAAETWVLGSSHVRCWKRFGLLPKEINVANVNRVEVCRTKRRSLQKMTEDKISGEDCVGGRRFGIRLVRDTDVLAELELLTEGEALFIARELRKRYRDKFPELFEADISV